MTVKEIIAAAKDKMGKSADAYQRDMVGLRAGRANPKLLDKIMVDYYGTPTPIKSMGNISSPEARMLVISPYDAKSIRDIEKAIQKSDLGLNPSNDGKVIRLVFPELNAERRKELTKVAKKGADEAKTAIRNIRREANDQVDKLKKASEITEDEQRKGKDEIQKVTGKAEKDVDAIYAAKEKEIMEV